MSNPLFGFCLVRHYINIYARSFYSLSTAGTVPRVYELYRAYESKKCDIRKILFVV